MKKIILVLAAVALFASGAFAQFGYGGESKFSFSLFGGFGLSQAKGTSYYEDSWAGYLWDDVFEYADLNYKADNGVYFGGALTYMFSPNIGLQLGGGLFGRNVPNDSLIGFDAWAGSSEFYDEYAYAGTGKLTTIPLYINFVGRFSMGMLDFNVSAGPTLFFNSTEASATGIYGDWTWWYEWHFPWGWIYYEAVDFFPVGWEIRSQSWTGFGANFGLGFDFNLSPMFAIFLDARYFLCGAKELNWEVVIGTYNGIYSNLTDYDIDADIADYVYDLITTYKINPSFFVISGGFKVRFGGGSAF